MKFSITRDQLTEAVNWVSRSLPTRLPTLSLGGVKLTTKEKTLVFSSFDYEVSSTIEVGARIVTPGEILVPGRLLSEITKALPNQPIEANYDGSKLTLNCGKTQYSLPTLNITDYPELPTTPPAIGSVAAGEFTHSVSQTAVAAGREENVAMLTGIKIEITKDKITLAATDRFRLAIKEISWVPSAPDLEFSALVPARTLVESTRPLMAKKSISLHLANQTEGEKLFGLDSEKAVTTTRLLDSEFPKFRSLLPTESSTQLFVEVAELVEAIKRVTLVTDRKSPLVRLALSDAEVVVTAAAVGDEATAKEVIGATLQGEGFEIAFNPTYLLDGLNNLSSQRARFAFNGPTKPVVIVGVSDKNDEPDMSYQYLLMPIRLPG
jgi:DNA polymerase-3 subunit beta